MTNAVIINTTAPNALVVTQSPTTNAVLIATTGPQGIAGPVQSVQGTSNQVLVDNTVGIPQLGALTLSLPQSIATTSSPTFQGLTLAPGATTPVSIDSTAYTPTSSHPQGIIIRNNNVYSNAVTYGSGAVLIDNSGAIDNDQPHVFIVNNNSTLSNGNTAALELCNVAGGFSVPGSTSTTNTNFSPSTPIGLSIELVALNESVGTVSTVTITNGGSGYVDSTYTLVPLTTTTGHGINATATITVSGGVVTSVVATGHISSSQGGSGAAYVVGDTLSASNTNLGGTGSGLVLTVASVVGYNGKLKINTISGVTGAQSIYTDGYFEFDPRRSTLSTFGANTGFEEGLRFTTMSSIGQGWLTSPGSGFQCTPIYDYGVESQISLVNSFQNTNIQNTAQAASGKSATIENWSTGAGGSSYIRTKTSTGGATLYSECDDTSSAAAVIVRSNWGGTAGTGKSEIVLYTDNTSSSPSGWSFVTAGTGTGGQTGNLNLNNVVNGTTTTAITYTMLSSGAMEATHEGTGGTYYRVESTSGSGGATSYIQANDANQAAVVVRSNWLAAGVGNSALQLFTDNTSSNASGWQIATTGTGTGGQAGTLFFKCFVAGTGTQYLSIGNTGIITVLATTSSTSITTGALVVDGGLGVAGAVFAGSLNDNGNRVLTTVNAGTDISVSGSSPSITINDTSTLATVTGRGATTTTAVTVQNALSVGASSAATSGANVNSPTLSIGGNVWNGTTSISDQFNFGVSYAAGSNPLATLTLSHSGSSGGSQMSLASGNMVIGGGGNITKYKGVSTAGAGVVPIYATKDLTAQAANIALTALLTSPTAGMYRVSGYTVVSTSATSSSTLPDVTLIYGDQDSGATITVQLTSGSTGNTTSTYNSNSIVINANNAHNIQFQTGVNTAYASSGATAMNYSLRLRLEYLG